MAACSLLVDRPSSATNGASGVSHVPRKNRTRRSPSPPASAPTTAETSRPGRQNHRLTNRCPSSRSRANEAGTTSAEAAMPDCRAVAVPAIANGQPRGSPRGYHSSRDVVQCGPRTKVRPSPGRPAGAPARPDRGQQGRPRRGSPRRRRRRVARRFRHCRRRARYATRRPRARPAATGRSPDTRPEGRRPKRAARRAREDNDERAEGDTGGSEAEPRPRRRSPPRTTGGPAPIAVGSPSP